jgi:phage protein D/phage baseplate assembly protein gpV
MITTVPDFGVWIDGKEIGALEQVTELRIHRAPNLAASAEVCFRAAFVSGRGYELPVPATALGADLKIEIGEVGARLQTAFQGTIVGLDSDVDPGMMSITIRAFDKAHKLNNGPQYLTYLKIKYPDVARQILDGHGFSSDVVNFSTEVHDHLSRTTSDRDFLCEIAERFGCEWWVDPDKKFHFAAIGSGSKATVSAALATISARHDITSFTGGVEIRGWDSGDQRAIVAKGKPKYDGLPNGAGSITPARGDVMSAELHPASKAEAKTLEDAVRSRFSAVGAIAEVDTELRLDIGPGCTVTIEEAGLADGAYFVRSVSHEIRAGSSVTHLELGGVDMESFADLVLDDDITPSWATNGPVTGIVTNTKDEEGLGRVKVKFPQLSDIYESGWARLVTPRGGPETGLRALPSIGDEVIVVFEDNDHRRPLILGGVWSKLQKPPAAFDLETVSEEVALVLPDGLTMLAMSGNKAKTPGVLLQSEAGRNRALLEFTEKASRLEVTEGTLTISGGKGQGTVKIDDEGNVIIESKGDITVKSTGALGLEGQTVTIKAKTKVEVSAGTEIKVAGSAGAELSSSAQTVVKGSIVAIN